MSAIGDYIHLHAANYLTYGTFRRGQGENSWVDSYNAQMQINKSRIDALAANNAEINNTLDRLKEIIKDESLNTENTDRQELERKWQQDANQAIQEYQSYIINQMSNTIISKSAIKKNIQESSDQTDYKNLMKAIQVRNNIYKKIEQINKNDNAIPQSTITQLLNLFDEFFALLGMKSFRNVYKGSLSNRNTLNQLYNMLRNMQINKFQLSTYNGELGEYIIASCGNIALKEAGQAINDSLTSLIKGDEKSSFSLDESLLPKKVQEELVRITDGQYNLYRIQNTQNKVDVEIQFNDMNLGVSVKNYKRRRKSKGAHLQDVNLIYQLAAAADNFGNHWLNIHSLDIEPGRDQMDDALTQSVRYEALVSGNLMKGASASLANVFIAIDAQNGSVIAKTSYDILTKSDEISNFIIKPLVSSINLSSANVFVEESYETRIANILNALRRYKIAVNYKLNF